MRSGASDHLAAAMAPNVVTQGGWPTWWATSTPDMVRSIQRLRVGFSHDGRIFVRPRDLTFQTVLSSDYQSTALSVLGAGGCNCAGGRNAGYASLDLHGTPFTVAVPNVALSGQNPTGYVWVAPDAKAV